ncbi:MAG: 3-isopropylmalate dehydratase small subunit [Trueperaceae bacterium]|nr:3-isopropylmalate dehydratase small subunit [Trueperaceae bacterium]
MALEPILHLRGRGVVVRGDDIDTDRIIPARYLRAITFDGLGDALFRDVRFDEEGRPLDHPLDRPERQGATILLSGRNFGCGSSREHAPQSIVRAGFRAVIAGSFAEIFFQNATTLGLACVALGDDDLAAVGAAVEADPAAEVAIDVAAATVTAAGRTYAGALPATAREALTRGRYDPLAELLEHDAAIAATAERLPYVAGSRT